MTAAEGVHTPRLDHCQPCHDAMELPCCGAQPEITRASDLDSHNYDERAGLGTGDPVPGSSVKACTNAPCDHTEAEHPPYGICMGMSCLCPGFLPPGFL